MEILYGNAVSSGIGEGEAFVIPKARQRIIPQNKITVEQVESEWARYVYARDSVAAALKLHLEEITGETDDENFQRELLETYLQMLNDEFYNKELKDFLQSALFNAEYIIDAKAKEYASRLKENDDPYFAERAQDITDIFDRVLNKMLNIHLFNIEEIPSRSILIAESLNPSEALVLKKKHIAGIALAQGGISSHLAILARGYSIPAVFAVPHVTKNIKTGETVVIDAENSQVVVNPDADTMAEYKKEIKKQAEHLRALEAYRDLPALSKDGTKFLFYANIGTAVEAKNAIEHGAEGIGLFRTEFLFMNVLGKIPESGTHTVTEETQFKEYKKVLEMMENRAVTVRTLDAGGDKLLKLVDAQSFDEANPLMGLRAIRFSSHYPKIFKTQLRALYRASVFGNLRIMFPLITSVSEVVWARKMAEEVRDELAAQNIPFNKNVPLGIMMETAAAGIIAGSLAKYADFFSIGTNDLVQYTIGVDRENSNVAQLYDEFHPAVLYLIKRIVTVAKRAKIPISVCGEMAGRIEGASVLAGMGLRNLSMNPSQLSPLKEEFANLTLSEQEEKVNKLLKKV